MLYQRATIVSCTIFLAALSGCGGSGTRPREIVPTPPTGAVVGRTALGSPLSVPATPLRIIPLAIDRENTGDRDGFEVRGKAATPVYSTSVGGRGYFRQSGADSVRWHNAVIQNAQSGEERTVLDRRDIISRAWIISGRESAESPITTSGLVFVATLEDTNKDGMLNSADATVVIAADASGQNLRVVSPPFSQSGGFIYESDRDELFMMVSADTNADGKFIIEDEPVPYVVNLRGSGVARPVLSNASVERMKSLLK